MKARLPVPPAAERCWINGLAFALDGKTHLTGAQIRALPMPSIRDTDDLWVEVPGNQDLFVEYDEVVPVAGRRFFSAPKIINAGAPDADAAYTRERGMLVPPHEVRLKMAKAVVELASLHNEAARDDEDVATATWVGKTLVVTCSHDNAHELAALLDALGIAYPERFDGTNWPKERASDA